MLRHLSLKLSAMVAGAVFALVLPFGSSAQAQEPIKIGFSMSRPGRSPPTASRRCSECKFGKKR